MNQYRHHLIEGAGIGLRSKHYQDLLTTDGERQPAYQQDILAQMPEIPWLEVLTDNYLGGGQPLDYLQRLRERYPVTFHGVGMSLASADPLDQEYLRRVRRLADQFEPAWISDHIAWVSVAGRHLHELMPIPYTRESLALCRDHILQAQDLLARPLLIENPSAYLNFSHSEMPEWSFLEQLVQQTDCRLLLDINNIHVSAHNNGFSAEDYLSQINPDHVTEIHLAGYQEMPDYLFDTHGHTVHRPVWDLYLSALLRFGSVPTLIEWDTDIPTLTTLLDEAAKAQLLLDGLQQAA